MKKSLFIAALFGGNFASAQIDSMRVVVDTANATGGNSLGAAAYNAPDDSMFSAGFGAGQTLRKTTGVGTTQVSNVMVSESQLQQFLRDGDPDRGTVNPIISGIVLNPVAVGTFAANSFAIVVDIASTRFPASTTTDPSATKRLYRYNLQAVGPASAPPPPYGDGRDVFTTMVTLSQMNAAKGASSSNTSSNTGRQGAFSLDGTRFYFVDSAAALGGIYKTDVLNGGATLLLNTSGINTEPAVIPAPGGGDRILVQGVTGNNPNGINSLDHDGSSTGSFTPFVLGSTIQDFLERPAADADIRSVSADANGDVFFWDTTSKVLIRYDAQGRLSKVLTSNERMKFRDQIGKTGSVNGNLLRMQPRTITHPTAGAITEVLYSEQTAQNYVAGAYAFAAGDFDRDGAVTQADLDLLAPILTPRGVVQTDSSMLKFDLNGNATVDWKDVKLLQQFYPGLYDGDANLDGVVDISDLATLATNWQTGNRAWTGADFTGDDFVDISDLAMLATNWQSGVPLAQALSAVGLSSVAVPEPAALAAIPVGLAIARRRSRNSRMI